VGQGNGDRFEGRLVSRIPLGALVRRLAHRGGTTLVILIIAVLSSATAAVGPIYNAAARTSILRDTLASAPVIDQGIEATTQGVVARTFGDFSATVNNALVDSLDDPNLAKRLFAPPIDALEATAFFASLQENPYLVWRTDFCAHLNITQGKCATAKGQVIISGSLAQTNHWVVGQKLAPFGWGQLTVVGVYAIPDFTQPYWFNRGTNYFPAEDPGKAQSPPDDALFTVRDTIDGAAGNPQGILVIDQLINRNEVDARDLTKLANGVQALIASPDLTGFGSVETGFPDLVAQIKSSWRSLAVPVVLVSLQTLLLVWLLLYLVMTDAVEARGPEIALVKLRGFGRFRVLSFGLGDPVALLIAGLPIGVLLGWVSSAGLAHALLRPGTSIGVPALAWAAAAVATVGGFAAVVVAAQRTLRRSVVDQWRRTGRRATDRGWVLDAVVLTGAVAGLVELAFTGSIGSVGHGSLGLLVPALVGLAVAVVASRLLPIVCRAVFRRTRRAGSLGTFLAVRYVARRPGGVRTTIILATAFALATFGVAAWAIGNANRTLVAGVTVGAPAVIGVQPPAGENLTDVVDAIDPGGGSAMAVDSYVAFGSGGITLLGVDPARFPRIASWRNSFASASLAELTKQLDPPSPGPLDVGGDHLRVQVNVTAADRLPLALVADLATGVDTAPVEVQLGTITRLGPQTLTVALGGCPCFLRDLSVSLPSIDQDNVQVSGSLTINEIAADSGGTWTPIGPDALSASHWKVEGDEAAPAATSSSAGLVWPFAFSSVAAQQLSVIDRPDPLPAIVSTTQASGTAVPKTVSTTAFDGTPLSLRPVARAEAVPGSPAGGFVVDRTFAEIAAGSDLLAVDQQVWTTAAAAGSVEAALRAKGVEILSVSRTRTQAKLFDRQGPGLASVLYLADAAAAVVLAVGGAVLGLVVAGRRRKYEYAALIATGASRRTLYRGLLLEQGVVLIYGAIVGIVAGLVAVLVAIRSVPEFVTAPATPKLVYAPTALPLIPVLAVSVVVLLVVAALASRLLLAGVRSEQLREGAP
jgi:putative ABC transport system permease protein